MTATAEGVTAPMQVDRPRAIFPNVVHVLKRLLAAWIL
jgi:hypothetical protein